MNQQQLTAVQTREQYYTDELTRLNERVAELELALASAESLIQNISDLAVIGASYPTVANYQRIERKCREWLKQAAAALEE